MLDALTTAAHHQQALAAIVHQAAAGHPQAAKIVNALQLMKPPAARMPVHAPSSLTAIPAHLQNVARSLQLLAPSLRSRFSHQFA